MTLLLSHVDVRVRNRAQSQEFYDAILNVLGATMDVGKHFTTWQIPPPDAPPDWEADNWFGITEDPAMTPNGNRISFIAPSRGTVDAIAMILPTIGARAIEPPHEAYGPNYYAVFFEDLDGNKLEMLAR